jgi:hypothetical protein
MMPFLLINGGRAIGRGLHKFFQNILITPLKRSRKENNLDAGPWVGRKIPYQYTNSRRVI